MHRTYLAQEVDITDVSTDNAEFVVVSVHSMNN
jgi:hypothetical protein